uniref:Fungal lipase-type domain-containing protein n=1 Tax=Alexandrium monilatum TaxID=311494 RepID=A0A7S4Q8Q6_9DINO
MGCAQGSAKHQQGAQGSAASPASAGAPPGSPTSPTSPRTKPGLVKYRTLLTGQTNFEASGSKAASKANSRCTSRASMKSDEDGSANVSIVLGERELCQSLPGDASPRTDCSPAGRDVHFNPRMAAQAGSTSAEDMLFAARLASLAYVRSGTRGSALQSEEVSAALQAATCGADSGSKTLDELVSAMGLTLERRFWHGGAVQVQGYVAHSEADLVLAFSSPVRREDADTASLAGTAEFSQLAEGTGDLLGLFGCCQGSGICLGAAPCAHEGYLNAVLATIPDLEQAVLPRLRAQQPVRVIVTGHDVGGAVATGALAYVLRNVDLAATPHRVLFVSAGQPRFGDSRFRAWLEREVTRLAAVEKCKFARLVHDSDPVPAGPPGMPFLAHVGVPHVLTQQGEMILGEEALGSVEVKAAELGEVCRSHQLAKYLELLGKRVQQPTGGQVSNGAE